MQLFSLTRLVVGSADAGNLVEHVAEVLTAAEHEQSVGPNRNFTERSGLISYRSEAPNLRAHRSSAALLHRQLGAAQHLRAAFADGRGDVIGTSGTVTSLAGVFLDLPRYNRARVDGMWFDVADCRAVIASLLAQSREQRAANPCIGKDRADLVVIGGAILDAVLCVWPAKRIRVADRGLREGVLMRLMAQHAPVMSMIRARYGFAPGRLEEIVIEHRRLIDACRRRDADGGAAIMRAHIGRSIVDILTQRRNTAC